MENEFNRDFAGEIALECEKLEKTLFVGMEEYSDSAVYVGGAKWYSIALEDSDSGQEKDDEGKRNILLRLIDKIIEFIKMVGKKIVEWFQACKAAIVKFFTKDNIDPAAVASRFGILIEDFGSDSITKFIAKLSKENKDALAEVLSPEYNKAFNALYADFTKLGEKASNVVKFAVNRDALVEFKDRYAELKSIADKGNIYETVDVVLKKLLSSEGNNEAIKNVTTNFTAAGNIHNSNVSALERLLKQIPDDDLVGIEVDNIAIKRQDAVRLISDVIKVNSDIVMKINNHMQAVTVLMTNIVKFRSRQAAYIPV